MGRPPKGVQEIIEIGAVKVNPVGEILSRFSYFVKPWVNPVLSGFCKKLTSIKQEEVNRASKFPKVVEEFKDWIDIYDEDYQLCSWGKFDVQLLKNDCALHKLDDEWLDHNINLKAQYVDIKGHVKYTGLKNTLKREGFEFTGRHHRAINDAENTAKIFIKLIDEWRY